MKQLVKNKKNKLNNVEKMKSSEPFIYILGGRQMGKSAFTLNFWRRLTALDILLEKGINLYWLKISQNVSDYNRAVGHDQRLKKKTYNFLKEVLYDSGTIKTEAR